METTDEEGWVTGPAIELLVLLRAMVLGDLIRVEQFGKLLEGKVAVTDWDDTKYNCPIRIELPGGVLTWIHEKQIRAWKRPMKKDG